MDMQILIKIKKGAAIGAAVLTAVASILKPVVEQELITEAVKKILSKES